RKPATKGLAGLVPRWLGVRSRARERKIATFLSRRADSNCRPAVYETVVGGASESQRVHLLASSCRTMPVSARADRASGVRTGVNAAPQECCGGRALSRSSSRQCHRETALDPDPGGRPL